MSANPRVERFEVGGRLPPAPGESPGWRAAEQALYWVDIPAKKIVRGSVETGQRTEWQLPEQVACIAFDHAGTVLAGCETGLFAVTLADASKAAGGEPLTASL